MYLNACHVYVRTLSVTFTMSNYWSRTLLTDRTCSGCILWTLFVNSMSCICLISAVALFGSYRASYTLSEPLPSESWSNASIKRTRSSESHSRTTNDSDNSDNGVALNSVLPLPSSSLSPLFTVEIWNTSYKRWWSARSCATPTSRNRWPPRTTSRYRILSTCSARRLHKY